MQTRPLGSAIGAIGGMVFVLVNASVAPAPLLWRILAVIAAVAIIWFVVLRGPEVDSEPPSRSAVRTYGLSVTAMLVAIPLGAKLIVNVLDRPDGVLVWVVFAVGAHFFPFARAFHLPVYGWLSVSLIVVSLIGAVPALVYESATAAAWTGLAAGVVLFCFSAVGPALMARARETSFRAAQGAPIDYR